MEQLADSVLDWFCRKRNKEHPFLRNQEEDACTLIMHLGSVPTFSHVLLLFPSPDLDTDNAEPTGFSSSRRYYEDLAIETIGSKGHYPPSMRISAAVTLEVAPKALGRVLEGHTGRQYAARTGTLLWTV